MRTVLLTLVILTMLTMVGCASGSITVPEAEDIFSGTWRGVADDGTNITLDIVINRNVHGNLAVADEFYYCVMKVNSKGFFAGESDKFAVSGKVIGNDMLCKIKTVTAYTVKLRR